MEEKRATAVGSFNLPYTLYNLEEMLRKMQQEEHSNIDKKQSETTTINQ